MMKIDQSYIPYDCQFLLIKQSNKTIYEIFEFYKINNRMKSFKVTYFGTWNKANELTVPKNDFYGRRLNMNGTLFGVLSSCSRLNDVSKIDNIKLDKSCLMKLTRVNFIIR